MHPTEVWEGTAIGPRLARLGLLPLSGLYALGWTAYRAIYDLGLKKAQAPHPRVVCVGNLTVGGSGKTPVTLALADLLLAQGHRVVIGCSGYGSPAAQGAQMAPPGELEAQAWGDEPALFRWLRPEIPLVVGRARVRAAALAFEAHPDSILVMDDGFQHLPLHKQVTILLDDPAPRNPWPLPAGPYREPRSNRRRATMVLSTTEDIRRIPDGIKTPDGGVAPVTKAQVVCAIGQPERFLASLRDQGVRIEAAITAPDHDPLLAGTLLNGLRADIPIVVTAKDWVKIRRRPDVDRYRWRIAHERAELPAGIVVSTIERALKLK